MWFFKLPQYQNEYILQHNAMICEDDDFMKTRRCLYVFHLDFCARKISSSSSKFFSKGVNQDLGKQETLPQVFSRTREIVNASKETAGETKESTPVQSSNLDCLHSCTDGSHKSADDLSKNVGYKSDAAVP